MNENACSVNSLSVPVTGYESMRKKEKPLSRERNFTWKRSEEYGRDEKKKRNPRIGIQHGEK